MALSGTIYSSVIAGGYQLQVDWNGVQNVSGNTTQIWARSYWCSLGSSYTVSSSASKSGSITIDGNVGSFSTTAGLGGNQRKLLHEHSVIVTHNPDGTKTIPIASTFNIAVTLGGTFYSSISASQTVTLNTIPRQSTMTSSPNFIAGTDVNVTVERQSSSFVHGLNLFVNNVLIHSTPDFATNIVIPTSTKTEVFNQLNTAATEDTRFELYTKSGASIIGITNYLGTVTAPQASTTPSTASFNIGDSVPITINRALTSLVHTLRFYVGATLIHTSPAGQGASYTWVPTVGEKNAMYAATPNSKTIASSVQIDTFFSTEKVRTTQTTTGTATVINSNPTFGTGYTYLDDNATVTTITGNNQYIVQNKSTVLVTLPTASRALPVNGATMVNYIATLAGKQVTTAWSGVSNVTFDFNTISASSNQILSIKAVDSRGNSTTTTKTVTVLPYASPVVVSSANRTNGFDNNTTLTMSGTISLVTVASVNKNSVQLVQYRYKKTTEVSPSTWTTWSNFTYSTSTNTYTATNVVLNLDNTFAWNVEFMTTDKFGNTVVSVIVNAGTPLMFIDKTLKSVGVNRFPTGSNAFEVLGDISAIKSGGNITAKGVASGTSNLSNFNVSDSAGTIQGQFGALSTGNLDFTVRASTGNLVLESNTGTINANDNMIVNSGTLAVPIAVQNNFGGYYMVSVAGVNAFQSADVGMVGGKAFKIEGESGGVIPSFTANATNAIFTGALTVTGTADNDINGKVIITRGGQTLDLKAGASADHVYLAFYADSAAQTTRSGYIGYSSAGMNDMIINNQQSNTLNLTTSGGTMSFLAATHGVLTFGQSKLKFLNTPSEIQVRNSNDTAYAVITASAFTVNSEREVKTNIEPVPEGALDKVMNTHVYDYHLKDELNMYSETVEGEAPEIIGEYAPEDIQKRMGLILDEAPEELLSGASNDGIDLYAMNSLLWKAVQELNAQVVELRTEINNLKGE